MEPFEQFYDDDEEEWHLRDAVRVDNRVYHPVCYDDYKEVRDAIRVYHPVCYDDYQEVRNAIRVYHPVCYDDYKEVASYRSATNPSLVRISLTFDNA